MKRKQGDAIAEMFEQIDALGKMKSKTEKDKGRIMNETADERAATDEVMWAQSFSKVLKRLHVLLRGEEQGKLNNRPGSSGAPIQGPAAKHHVLLRGEQQARIQRGPNPGPSSKTSRSSERRGAGKAQQQPSSWVVVAGPKAGGP